MTHQKIGLPFGCGKCLPPAKEHVVVYFLEKGLTEKHASDFFSLYNKRRWRNRQGNIIANWKVHAWEWAFANRKTIK